jgi:hypothetical protein
MKKLTICALLFLNICVIGFSQNSINREVLDNFYEYRSEITDYFMYYYDEDYSGEMLFYNSKLMTIFSNIERGLLSDEVIDLLIQLYKKTMALKVPKEDIEMYIEAGLGNKGHKLYTNIISIMYFRYIETYMKNYSPENQVIAKNGLNKLKKLFTRQEWDLTVEYFNNKYK